MVWDDDAVHPAQEASRDNRVSGERPQAAEPLRGGPAAWDSDCCEASQARRLVPPLPVIEASVSL